MVFILMLSAKKIPQIHQTVNLREPVVDLEGFEPYLCDVLYIIVLCRCLH